MTTVESNAKDSKLTQQQKTSIVENFLVNVQDIEKSIKIQRIALSLSDYDDTSDEYYAFLYFYSQEENWPKIDEDYEEFYVPGYFGVNEKPSSESTLKKVSSNEQEA